MAIVTKISHPKLKNVSIKGFCVLFTGLIIFFFNKIFIKNRSQDTIHTFKNYFVTMFSVFSSKWYPNRSLSSFTSVSIQKFVYFIIIIFFFFTQPFLKTFHIKISILYYILLKKIKIFPNYISFLLNQITKLDAKQAQKNKKKPIKSSMQHPNKTYTFYH